MKKNYNIRSPSFLGYYLKSLLQNPHFAKGFAHWPVKRISENPRLKSRLKNYPMIASTVCSFLSLWIGIKFPDTFRPSIIKNFTLFEISLGFLTFIIYLAPRKVLLTVKPFQFEGIQGSTRSPSYSGRIPRIYWLAA